MIATSPRLVAPPARMTETATASAALGPLISALVPPNSAATKPTMTMHQRPATAPIPEAIPSPMPMGTEVTRIVMPLSASAWNVSRE